MVVVERFTFTVSFAVLLQDDYSREAYLVGRTKVFIQDSGITAIENPSGYHVFTDQPATAVNVRIENPYYFDREISVDIAALDSRYPVVNAVIKPRYLYPFPAASTLIRGAVADSAGAPIAGASITVMDTGITNHSESDGRFVLYFPPLTEDDIALVDSHRYVEAGGTTTLRLGVTHPAYAPSTITIGTVDEGTTKLLTTKITLVP